MRARMGAALRPTSVAVLLALAFAVGSVLNRFVRHGLGYREPVYQLDLDVYRHGALAWLQGMPVMGPHDIGPATITEPMPFTYPPIAAVLFVPTTWAPWPVVMAAWTALSIGALLVALVVLARAAGTTRRTAWVLGLLVTGVCVNLEPFVAHLQLGQIGVLLMALVALDLGHPSRRRPRGILLGLAIAIKLNPAVFGLYLLLRRDWHAIGVTAASALGFTALGWALAPADSAAYWGDLAGLGGQVAVFEQVSNTSLAGLLDRLPLGGATTPVWLMLVLATVVLTARAMLLALGRGQAALALALNGLLVPLISPVAWEHHWVWLGALLVLFVAGVLQAGVLQGSAPLAGAPRAAGPELRAPGAGELRAAATGQGVFRGGAVMAALAFATALMFRETGVSGVVPGSWALYIGWAGLVILLLNWSGSYPSAPSPSSPDPGGLAARSGTGHLGVGAGVEGGGEGANPSLAPASPVPQSDQCDRPLATSSLGEYDRG